MDEIKKMRLQKTSFQKTKPRFIRLRKTRIQEEKTKQNIFEW